MKKISFYLSLIGMLCTLSLPAFAIKDNPANEMEIEVPLTAVSLSSKKISFNFHCKDNIQKLNDITAFFTDGDSAPERRFDYHYTTLKQ